MHRQLLNPEEPVGKTTKQPVSGKLRQKLWLMVIASLLFLSIAHVEGLQRPDFDHWQQSVSALSLGPRGWIQILSFFVFGSIVLSTVPVWRSILAGGTGAKAFPILTALTGLSLIVCGIAAQDPAPGYDPQRLFLAEPTLQGLLHLLFAAIGALSSVIGLLVMAKRFAENPAWRGWTTYTIFMAILMVLFITIYAIWSTSATGYAGTFERLGLLVAPVWCATFLVRLRKGVHI